MNVSRAEEENIMGTYRYSSQFYRGSDDQRDQTELYCILQVIKAALSTETEYGLLM